MITKHDFILRGRYFSEGYKSLTLTSHHAFLSHFLAISPIINLKSPPKNLQTDWRWKPI